MLGDYTCSDCPILLYGNNFIPPIMCHSLLEILSLATNHYAISMQLVVVCNYLGHVCNYKFGIV